MHSGLVHADRMHGKTLAKVLAS